VDPVSTKISAHSPIPWLRFLQFGFGDSCSGCPPTGGGL
jgi:hypothetical protein